MSWAERATAYFSETPLGATDETDETGVLTVLSVGVQALSKKHDVLVDLDDRHRCPACTGLRGSAARGWQCNRHRAARVGRDLPRELVELPQRCPAFTAITGPGLAADLPVQAHPEAMTRTPT
jgi:hypothetical protein